MIRMLVKRGLFHPDDYRKNVHEIEYQALLDMGIKVLLIDLDNTLIPYDRCDPDASIISLFKKLREMGFMLAVISNNHTPRVERFTTPLGCPYIAHAKKPYGFGFRQAEKRFGITNHHEICLIGDQFMTDVLGGKRRGYRVIVVDAIQRKTEKWFTRMNRKMEERVLKYLAHVDGEWFRRLRLAEKR